MTNRFVSLEREMILKLNLFQLMFPRRSWDSVLISIYRIDANDLKNRNAHAREQWKNALHSSMNSALKLLRQCSP